MPISNGFDAIRKIIHSYQGLVHSNSSGNDSKSQDQLFEMADPRNDSSSKGNFNSSKTFLQLNENDLLPVILALSSYIDSDTLAQTEKAGFSLTLECPLTQEMVYS